MSETLPRHEGEKRFIAPKGFTYASDLPGNEPSTVGEYVAKGLTGAEPGTWSSNNGTLAIVTSEGRIAVWIPKADANAPREVSHEQAVQSLKNAGYKEARFYVPFSS